MVPNGWELNSLSALTNTVMGYAFKSADFVTEGTPLLRMGNLYQNQLNFDRKPIHLPVNFKNIHSKFVVKSGDLVMSMTGTMGKRDYGFTVQIPNNSPESLLNQRVIKFVPKNGSSLGYLLYLLRSELVLSRLYSIPGGTKQANLSAKQIQELQILIPPLSEQQKIAKILSTWDKAISTTEALIDNSKQQKKALMQQLLTGKKRFAGFEGEWEEVKLGSIFPIVDSLHQTPEFSGSGYPMIRVTDIKGGNLSLRNALLVSESVFKEYTKKYQPKCADIVFSRVGSYGNSSIVQTNELFCLGQNTVIAASNRKADSQYIYQFLNTEFTKKQIEKTVDGSSHKTVSLKIIRNLKILTPSLQEQKKIAAVLINADKEIELLKQQLADLKQEKKALMQQLLTGKRRVKIDGVEAA